MQNLMTSTYPSIAIEAIKNGWDGAWERLIANKLCADYNIGHSEAECIIKSIDPHFVDPEVLLKAAYLITSSTIQTHEQTT